MFNYSIFEMCVDWEKNWDELEDVSYGELFDDEYLILCYIVFYVVVVLGYKDVVY